MRSDRVHTQNRPAADVWLARTYVPGVLLQCLWKTLQGGPTTEIAIQNWLNSGKSLRVPAERALALGPFDAHGVEPLAPALIPDATFNI